MCMYIHIHTYNCTQTQMYAIFSVYVCVYTIYTPTYICFKNYGLIYIKMMFISKC